MGGKSSTTSQTVSIPPEVLARYNAVNARAETVAQQPYTPYSYNPDAFVAPLNQTQVAGINNVNSMQGAAYPYYNVGSQLTMAGAQGVSPGGLNVGNYYNPFTDAVAAPTYAALRQQQAEEMQGATANAIKSGAFGGDRAGIVAANLARQQQLGMAQAMAPIYQSAYQQALQTAQQQQQTALSAEQANLNRYLQAGQQIAGLGTGVQQAGLSGAQAQIAAGTAEQQTQQAGLQALYNQFLQQQGYPFQVAQFLANIAMGTGALSGSTTTTTQPAPFFSDRRLKQNIRRIGETDDGQPIYRFQYKGDPKEITHIGFMADEVEKKHPEAVGLAPASDGKMYKTVDYAKATEGRHHRAFGGILPTGTVAFTPPPVRTAPQTGGDISVGGWRDPIPVDTSARVPAGPANPPEVPDQQSQLPQWLQRLQSLGGAGKSSVSSPSYTPGAGKSSTQSSNYLPGVARPYLGRADGGSIPYEDNSMGGAVNDNAYEGFAGGGLVSDEEFRRILAQQAQGLGIYGAQNPLGQGSPGGGKGIVDPSKVQPPSKLVTAGAAPKPQQSRMSELTQGLGQLTGRQGLGNQLTAAYDTARSGLTKARGLMPGTPSTPSTTPAASQPAANAANASFEGGSANTPEGFNVPGGSTPDLSDTSNMFDDISSFFARGGLVPHYANGGEADDDNGDITAPEGMYKPIAGGINIPDEKSKAKLPEPGKPPQQQSSGFGDILSIGAKVLPFFLARGGVVPEGYAEGGAPEGEYQPSDDELAVRTIMSEVGRNRRGEINPQEALGIAAVIANRAKQRGLSPGDVVLQSNQFEPWNKPGGANDPMKWDTNSPQYQQVAGLWSRAKEGEDPTGGASHFWGPGSQFGLGRAAPKWSGTGGPRYGGTQFEYVDGKPTANAAIPTERASVPAGGLGEAAEAQASFRQPNTREGYYVPGRQTESRGLSAPNSLENKPQGWGDFLTSRQFIVPLLTGLGAMASSNSRYLGSAMLQGLGAGAQAFEDVGKKEADTANVRAEEAVRRQNLPKIEMETRAIQAGLYERRWIPNKGMFVIDKSNPNSFIHVLDKDLKPVSGASPAMVKFAMEEAGKTDASTAPTSAPSTQTPATPAPTAPAPAAAPAPTPNGTSTTVQPGSKSGLVSPVDKPVTDIAKAFPEPTSVTKWTPVTKVPENFEPPQHLNINMDDEAKKRQAELSKPTLADLAHKAEAAYSQMYELDRMKEQFNQLPRTGFMAPGAYANQRKEFAERANYVVQALGGKPAFDPNDVAAMESIAKDTFRLGAALANSIGSREPGFIVQQSVQANPGITNTPLGFAKIEAGLREAARYVQDKNTFYNDYYSKFGYIDGAEEAFRRANPPKMYADRALISVVDPEDAKYLRSADKDNLARRSANIDKMYGRGVAKMLLGER